MGISPRPGSMFGLGQVDESLSSLVGCFTGLLVADDLELGEVPGASLTSMLKDATGRLLRPFDLCG